MPFEAFKTITDCKRQARAANKTFSRIQFKLSKDLTKCVLTFTEKLVLGVFAFPKADLPSGKKEGGWEATVEDKNSQKLKTGKVLGPRCLD